MSGASRMPHRMSSCPLHALPSANMRQLPETKLVHEKTDITRRPGGRASVAVLDGRPRCMPTRAAVINLGGAKPRSLSACNTLLKKRREPCTRELWGPVSIVTSDCMILH